MDTFDENMVEYRKQLQKGAIQKAYKGLMEYIMRLRTHFQGKYPEFSVPGNIYYGYMDMSYFSLFSRSLKRRKLKIAIVFIHEACRFEIWLAAMNKQIQSKYWSLFKESDWNKYRIVATTKGADSIVEHILVGQPDFSNLDSLTEQIVKAALVFIDDIEMFLAKADPLPATSGHAADLECPAGTLTPRG